MTEACHVNKHQRGRPAGTTGSSVFDATGFCGYIMIGFLHWPSS